MDKKLLTPGPLTTSLSTKEAMLHDWGSRDKVFIDLNHSIRLSLVKLIDGEDNYQCVPMQGSGTFAVESMISSLTPKNAKILMVILQTFAVVMIQYSLNNIYITIGLAVLLICVAWYVISLPSKVPNES